MYNQCPEDHYPYVIQPGDTLQFIANRLEVLLSRILAANPGIDPYNLRIGFKLSVFRLVLQTTKHISSSRGIRYMNSPVHLMLRSLVS